MSYLALLLILAGVCGLFGVLGWIADRKEPDPITRYQARWKTQGFRGW
jgi:hypothetical protein